MNTDMTSRRCGYCKGTGKVKKSEFGITTIACPVCNMKGAIDVPSDYTICSHCDGTGRIVSGFAMSKTAVCDACEGKGWTKPD
jgi:DnaJ-class molecular chaperone